MTWLPNLHISQSLLKVEEISNSSSKGKFATKITLFPVKPLGLAAALKAKFKLHLSCQTDSQNDWSVTSGGPLFFDPSL